MRGYRMSKIMGVAGSAFVGVLLGGCGLGQGPNPAAILAGDWQIKTTQPGPLDKFDIRANFDADGKLTQVTATPPFGGTAILTTDNTTTIEVNGNQVTVTIPGIGLGTLIGLGPVIRGTLSDDQNTITGTLSQDLTLSHTDFSVTLPGSDITLTRIQ